MHGVIGERRKEAILALLMHTLQVARQCVSTFRCEAQILKDTFPVAIVHAQAGAEKPLSHRSDSSKWNHTFLSGTQK